MAALMNVLQDAALRRERVVRDRSNPLELYDDQDIFIKYRFNREGVMFIIDLLTNELEHPTKRSHALSAPLQVFIALRLYATGSVLDSPATLHGCCSIATASRVVRRVAEAICGKQDEVSSTPMSMTMREILYLLFFSSCHEHKWVILR